MSGGSTGESGRYEAMMTDASKWRSAWVYWTVSLVWPGTMASAETERHAWWGREEGSVVERGEGGYEVRVQIIKTKLCPRPCSISEKAWF